MAKPALVLIQLAAHLIAGHAFGLTHGVMANSIRGPFPMHVNCAAARYRHIAVSRSSVLPQASALPAQMKSDSDVPFSWTEFWLDGSNSGSQSRSRDLAENIDRGALVIELAGVASPAECQLIVDAATECCAAAGRSSAAKTRLPTIAAAQRAASAWGGAGNGQDPLPEAADAKSEEIFRRVLAIVDEHLPSLATALFAGGAASNGSLATRHAAGTLEFASREPAVNVYQKEGQFLAHKDHQSLTILLSLSSPTSFTGGGTGFWHGDAEGEPVAVLRPAPGTVLLWGGDVMHAGMLVESGTRCVYVCSFSSSGMGKRRAETAAQSRDSAGELFVHPALRFVKRG